MTKTETFSVGPFCSAPALEPEQPLQTAKTKFQIRADLAVVCSSP